MPNPPTYTETGNLLPLLSLGGVLAQPGQGRTISSNSFTLSTVLGAQQIMDSNPKRISAVIQNVDDLASPGSYIEVFLGGLNTIPLILAPYGTLQIDRDFPWTGCVWANHFNNSNAPIVLIDEVSVT